MRFRYRFYQAFTSVFSYGAIDKVESEVMKENTTEQNLPKKSGNGNGVNGTSYTNEESPNKKRLGYLEWPDYFMAIAFLSAQRSKDPRSQVGACIINPDKRIVGTGYNGMPNACSDDKLSWQRAVEDPLDNKNFYVCHAELNAILNKYAADLKGCTMYVGLFPCNECAKLVIQSGISEVIYMSDKYHDKPKYRASRRLLDMAGVKYSRFVPKNKQITIDFDCLDVKTDGV